MHSFKITFEPSRIPIVSLITKEHSFIALWKRVPSLDMIIISVSGKEVYQTFFEHNIIQKIYDFRIPKEQRTTPLELNIVFRRDTPIGITVAPSGAEILSRSATELYDAVMAVDEAYSQIGRCIMYKQPLYKDFGVSLNIMRYLDAIPYGLPNVA